MRGYPRSRRYTSGSLWVAGVRLWVCPASGRPLADDGGPHISFNPYLEAGFALGAQSNCLGRHQKAGWTPQGFQESFPVHRGTIAPNDPLFAGNLKTHFLWSLVFRPRVRAQVTTNRAAADARPRGVLLGPGE